jgi:hypothetical protein
MEDMSRCGEGDLRYFRKPGESIGIENAIALSRSSPIKHDLSLETT